MDIKGIRHLLDRQLVEVFTEKKQNDSWYNVEKSDISL